MSIDWSKAPEGATHYKPTVRMFLRVEDGYAHFLGIDGRWNRTDSHISQYPQGMLIEREWTGAGLPPVGTVCEVFHRSPDEYWARHVGKVVTIVAHDITPIGSKVAVYSTLDDQGYKEYHGLVEACFRPIRTQEQIEAQERDREIQEMCDLLKAHRNSINGAMCEKLHGFGYRKQPKEGA